METTVQSAGATGRGAWGGGEAAGGYIEYDADSVPTPEREEYESVSQGTPPGGATLPEIGFYYPNQFWYSGDWIKNLILFFDGVGLLVPDYMQDRLEQSDPAIVGGLRDHGLLHVLEPETVVDKDAAEQLAAAMAEVISSGALDELEGRDTAFAELSMSRLGFRGDADLSRMIVEELESRDLARKTEDGVSIPLHPAVRALVLVLLAQILRSHGDRLGLDLSPVTDQARLVGALTELLSLPSAPSAGSVVTFDMATVGVDLGPAPIDEILDFRIQHFDEHRAYARKVRQFVRELGAVPEEQRPETFRDRQEELDDLARDLKRASRQAWKRPASFALTVAGAAWTAATGDPLSAILGGGAGLAGVASTGGADAGAYSYLFRAARNYA